MAKIFPKALRPGFRIASKKMMPFYPFEEAFFLPYARQVLDAVDLALLHIGGITKIDTVHLAMAEGFDFVAMGRTLLREPGLINKWRDGDTGQSLCVQCNKCMPSIYRGTHCLLVDEADRPGHAYWPPPRPGSGEIG